jgi:TonB family protein
VLVVALVPAPTFAQPAEPRGPQIDGSTKRSFETSIAQLQNELRPRQREDFERALAIIWLSHTIDGDDLDEDGDVDADDARFLVEDTRDLLTKIQRGDTLAAIEAREGRANGYTATEFLKELDGLDHEEVVELAGRPSGEAFLGFLRQQTARSWSTGSQRGFVPIDLCKLFPGPSRDEAHPIAAVAPRYPQRALERGQSGAVCLEFTLDQDGVPKDIVVLDSTSSIFERPALAALTQWEYQPRRLEPLRVRTQMVFQLGR